ncbi:teichoic acid transport system ATP-binding protein [Lachnospiraceae bacterium A10]|nr:teichoic acid transport system ATP-binding protein [Lachnospiraceae bacterium A10]
MEKNAISVKEVSKIYKLYDKPSDRFKEALGLSRGKKLYKEHYALNDLSFDIKKGECVGIIGTNGAGKSTILKIITGVLNPTMGDVEINGRISALLELGAGFNMEYTGIENVYINGAMIGFSREEIDKKMDDILAFADIGDFVYQPVKTYSSGMFVRLAFAVAINIDPEILIVDEALSVGDVFFQNKCYRKFEEFKSQGKTILFVSHDLGSISKYCDRVVLLNKGKKLSEGKPADMIDLYKKLLVNQIDDNGNDISAMSEKNDSVEGLEETFNNQLENKANHLDMGNKKSDESSDKHQWKDLMNVNPNVNAYGDGSAEIIDFAIVDANGNLSCSIEKGKRFKIKSKVKFNRNLEDPIFTYTFKTIQGTPITGTNTMYEKVSTGGVKEGDVYVATFEQQMDLQGGEYLLSISCTGYSDGDFQVYHRLYDVLNVTVISDKNTVGYYDMNSEVTLKKM